MAKKKKHQFHCQKCGNPCTIYKKGKGHRVLVCPHCGVLATNPISLKGLLGAAAGSIPVVGGVAQYAVENLGGASSKSAPEHALSHAPAKSRQHHRDYVDKLIEHELRV